MINMSVFIALRGGDQPVPDPYWSSFSVSGTAGVPSAFKLGPGSGPVSFSTGTGRFGLCFSGLPLLLQLGRPESGTAGRFSWLSGMPRPWSRFPALALVLWLGPSAGPLLSSQHGRWTRVPALPGM